ncbi:F-box protein SKIP19-like [Salvia divinorum]|uniref:F-box protein SKIP19-like n=1 Tax=Salvia divinorum TaxID=28513 RepID=A0ABD1HYN6_SALDI
MWTYGVQPSKIPVFPSSSAPPPPAVFPSSSAPPPPWIELPGDITVNIFLRLALEDRLICAQKVCTTWWKVSKEPSLWRVINFSNPVQGIFNHDYNVMCRRAVDLSQGQLVNLTIQYFGDDALIDYIAHRSPNLKRLKLGTCFFISGKYAIKMVAKLRQLEELHLTIRPGIGACHIEAIGISCPMLKSFSFNGFKCELKTYQNGDSIDIYFRNLYALAISRSMPNLRHLQVFAHWMGNKGLEAILHCCSRLGSLDIRRCFDLDLKGDLGKRCCQQIKHLKLPNDSVSDVPGPNCDGGDPFSTSAFCFEHYVYDYNDISSFKYL